jgi:hypothetical protein
MTLRGIPFEATSKVLRRITGGVFVLATLSLAACSDDPVDPGRIDDPDPEEPEELVPDSLPYAARNTYLEFRQNGTGAWTKATGIARKVPDTDRVVHHVKLTGLTPNSTINFRLPQDSTVAWYVTYEDDPTTTLTVHWHTLQPIPAEGHYDAPTEGGKVLSSYTMPATLPAGGLRIAQISDTHGRVDNANHISRLAARGARLLVHSGDIATGDGGAATSPITWYIWFDNLKSAVDDQGRLIPFIPAIGNHDVWQGGEGIQWTNGEIGHKPNFETHERGDAEWFYSFFPAFPGLQGYGVLDFGNYMSLWTLDPGITTRWDDGQADWLRTTLAARANVPHKLATMHFSPWPTGRRMMVPYYRFTRETIGPIIQQGGIRLFFVGHEHVLSKTVPINHWGALDHQSAKTPADPRDGVVFIGSGPGNSLGGPRQGRNPATKWWIEDSRPSEIVYFDFERDGFTKSSPAYEPRDPHPDDGKTVSGAAGANFWEIDLFPTGRTMRAVTGEEEEWGEFSQGVDIF